MSITMEGVSVLDERVEERFEGRVEEYVAARPAPPLRPFVERYSGYRQRGVPPAVHRGLPSPYLTMILTLDEPLVSDAVTYETLLGGLHTGPAIVTHSGAQSGVQLNLHPLGARALLGLPAGELRHGSLPADAVLGPLALELQDRLRTAETWPARFAALDQALLKVLTRSELTSSPMIKDVAPEVSRAWELLRAGEGRVSALAREVGWSARHLSARMTAETGLAPKAVARVVRFDRARRLLVPAPGAPPIAVADVAARCGFFDQAHLAREFRALAGVAPSAWLHEEFRSVQALRLDDEQDDRHE